MRELGESGPFELDDDLLVAGDAAAVLPRLPIEAFDLIYVDPPFNTGRSQRLRSVAV
jgi:site-specific DNA-methyltransferase (adenine-specific)